MGKDRVINSQSFHDGKVVIYQIENRPKQKWLCRLKVPNGVGYLYRGTGTSDLYEARKFADNLFQDLLIKVKLGESLTGYDFKKLLSEFELNYPSEAPSKNRVTDICLFLRTVDDKWRGGPLTDCAFRYHQHQPLCIRKAPVRLTS